MSELHLKAYLMSGEEIPMKVREDTSVSEFLKLTMPEGLTIPSLAIHNGRILEPSLTLKFQDVNDGDTIVVYRRGVQAIVRMPYVRSTPFEERVYSFILEAYRIDERKKRRLEASDHVIYELSSSDDEGEPQPETVLGPAPTEVSEAPLPTMFDSSGNSDEYVVPMRPHFRSLGDVGKFFMKEILDEWSW